MTMIYSKKLILSTLFLLLVLGVAVYYAPILIKKKIKMLLRMVELRLLV